MLTVSTPSASVLGCCPLSCLRSGESFAYLLVSTGFGRWPGPPTFRNQCSLTLALCQLSIEQVAVDSPTFHFHTMGMSKPAESALSEQVDQALESSWTEDTRPFDGQNT